MDAKKRARFAVVAGMLSNDMPADATRITPGSGPTLTEIATTILAVEAVVSVKGDAATAAAAARAHIASGRADAIVTALGKARPSKRQENPKRIYTDGDLVVSATTDQVNLEISVPGKSKTVPARERVVLSHTEHRCILGDDCAPGIDMDRLDMHVRILAEEIHRRDARGMTIEEVLQQLREKAPTNAQADFIRIDVAGVDWNVTGLYRNEVNHQSIEAWRGRVRAGINASKLSMRPKAQILDKAAALVERLNAEFVRQGRPPQAYQVTRGGTVCVGMPMLTERLTITDRSMSVQYANGYFENQLKESEDSHRKLTAMLQGRQPATRHEEVEIGYWRFDPVLLRLVAMHSRDPEDSLRRIVFGPDDNHYRGPNNPIGPDAPDFTTRVAKLEATIRVQIADGIAWSNGSVTINMRKVAIPEQLVGAMNGRLLGEIVNHPLLDTDARIVNATLASGRNGPGTVTLQTRRQLVPHHDVLRPLPRAA